jgi:uncharacterized protein with PIN domain
MNPRQRLAQPRSRLLLYAGSPPPILSKPQSSLTGAAIRWLSAVWTISSARLVIEAVTEAHARIAREAYRDFGRASGHPARLNFGDCFAYALARATGEPLLFKGNDFSQTDIASALT